MEAFFNLRLFCWLWVISIAFSSSLNSQTANIFVDPSQQSADSGSEVTIMIAIADVNTLHSYSITINYDSSYVDVASLNELEFFSPYSTLFLPNLNPNTSSLIVNAAILGVGNQSGSGNLFEIGFITKSEGMAQILLDSVILRDTENNDIEFTTTNGLINIMPVTNVESNINKNYEFELTNYPNPFNNSTIIKYNSKGNSAVDLKIFNLLGKVVFSRSISLSNIGEHQFVWNGRNSFGEELSSGIYLLNVREGNIFNSKKIILLK